MTARASIPIAVAALSVLCFLPALSGSFLNWDDNVNFTGNSAFQAIGPELVGFIRKNASQVSLHDYFCRLIGNIKARETAGSPFSEASVEINE